jgi:hypothetical protein
MRLHRVAICAAVALAGLPAGACPDGSEAARAGVAVSYDDGGVSTYRRGVDGMVEEVTLFDADGTDGYGVLAFLGVYLLEEFDLVDGQKELTRLERQRFATELKALPAPAPGLEWSGTSEVVVGDAPAIPRDVSLRVGQPERVDYGGCVYDSWPAVVRHHDANDDYLLGFDYLPTLGIAVLRSFTNAGEGPQTYLPVGVAPASP